jgi:hypothetical protein
VRESAITSMTIPPQTNVRQRRSMTANGQAPRTVPSIFAAGPARKDVHFWTFTDASPAHSVGMKNLREKLEKLRADADDCSAISGLTNDMAKRKLFARLAVQLRKMADDIEVEIANKLAGGET